MSRPSRVGRSLLGRGHLLLHFLNHAALGNGGGSVPELFEADLVVLVGVHQVPVHRLLSELLALLVFVIFQHIDEHGVKLHPIKETVLVLIGLSEEFRELTLHIFLLSSIYVTVGHDRLQHVFLVELGELVLLDLTVLVAHVLFDDVLFDIGLDGVETDELEDLINIATVLFVPCHGHVSKLLE